MDQCIKGHFWIEDKDTYNFNLKKIATVFATQIANPQVGQAIRLVLQIL